MKLKELKEAIEGLDDNLEVVALSGGAFYCVTDVDNTRNQLELQIGGHVEPA